MWDQELWMFPPVLLFHPTLSAIMLSSRNRLSSGAKFNAEQAKLTGLMFPWESGATGKPLLCCVLDTGFLLVSPSL